MAVVRRAFCVLGVLVSVVVAAGWGWGSAGAQGRKLVNLDKLARDRFHAYVGIQPLPLGKSLTKDGAVYWTAHQWGSDGTTVEVFRWRDGQIADLGSPGPNLTVWAVNNREQFLVGTTLVEQPSCPPPPPGKPPCRGLPQPPMHDYLREQRTLTDLGSLGGTNTTAIAINDRGQIVGGSDIENGAQARTHAFLWEKGKMIDLGTLGGQFSTATAINGHGQVIGHSRTAAGAMHGFIWEHGKMTDVAQPVAIFKQPVAINERGQVIGVIGYPGHTYLWQNGKTIRLGSLNLRGYPLVCRGVPRTSCPPHCPGPKCGRWGTVATAINDRGEVVGISRTNMDVGRAFLWRNGNIADLGTLRGRSSEALAINNLGMIVGWSDTRLVPWRSPFQAPGTRPFLWQSGRMVKLPVDYGSPTRATAITPSGTEILGDGGWPGHRVLLWLPR